MIVNIGSALSDEIKQALSIAQSVAKEYSNNKISPAHLLKGLLHKEIGLHEVLMQLDKDIYYMEEWADVRIETLKKNPKIPDQLTADEELATVISEAENIRLKLSKDTIDPLCALASLSTPGVGFSYEQLKTFPLTANELINHFIQGAELANTFAPLNSQESEKRTDSPKTTALLKFCIDKTQLARNKMLDPITARDREIRMIAEILGRRSKPNVIIIGDHGVGKTSLVNGFIQSIVEKNISSKLSDASVFELDMGAVIAGASYKGEIEDRLKNIIKEIKQFDKAILFIDDIHTLLDKQGGGSAASILKPELAKGEIIIIGATSIDNYTKVIESDESFKRSFETIKINEPNEDTALKMIETVMPLYEKHHSLSVEKEVLKEAIRLSKRYLKERSLPDSAIDLLDRTMSVVNLANEISTEDLMAFRSKLDSIDTNLKDSQNEFKWLKSQIENEVSEVLFAKIDNEDNSKVEDTEELKKHIENTLTRLEQICSIKKDKLDKGDVAAVVSHKKGIPLGKLQTQERDRLLNTEEHLKKRVVGQDHAIATITEAILESRSGLNKAGQPIGSFFFLGPTGTGKTELAKSLAEFLFQDESSLIRFDMSEFKEEHSAALLYGAPPGYVGYEEGGLLVNKIRQQPYSVVLFDEIEKAHTSVFDIFLQILDEGKLHDRLGKEGDFSNSLVLFTSNIGSQHIVDSFGEGLIPKSSDLMEIMSNYFRPEFLGRLTEIVPFAPISKEIVTMIFDIHLKGLNKMLDNLGIKLSIDADAKEHLAMSGFTPKYGARPLLGVIRNRLRRPLSKKIIAGEISKGSEIVITLQDSEITMNIK